MTLALALSISLCIYLSLSLSLSIYLSISPFWCVLRSIGSRELLFFGTYEEGLESVGR